jgi:hypothetical protein
LWPENIAAITIVHSTIEVSNRRKNTFAFEGDDEAGAVSGGMDEEVSGRGAAV